jgi:hypothetical protein
MEHIQKRYLKSLSCLNLQEYESRKEVKEFEAGACFNFREYGNSKGGARRYGSRVYPDFVAAPFFECWNSVEKEETPVIYNIPERWRTLEKLPLFCLRILYPDGANAKKHGIIQRIPAGGDWRRQCFSASKNRGKRIGIRDALTKIQEDQNPREFFMKNGNSRDATAGCGAMIANGVSRTRRQRAAELASLDELLNRIKNGTAKDTPNAAVETQSQYAQYVRKLRSAVKTGS